MKTLLLVITIIVLSARLSGQNSQCPALQAFNGEWRYVNGADTIRVYLRYHQFTYSINQPNETRGSLVGWHEYKRGDSIIESNYTKRNMLLPNNYEDFAATNSSIWLVLLDCDLGKQRLLGGIADLSQGRESKVVKAQFNTTINQLTWNQEHPEWYGSTGYTGMTLPRTFVLTKQ